MTEEGRLTDDPRQNLVNVVTDDEGCALTLCSVLFGQPAETIPEIYEVTIPRDACEAIAMFSARVGPVVIVWMHRGMNHKASETERRRQMGACKAVNTLMLRDARARRPDAPLVTVRPTTFPAALAMCRTSLTPLVPGGSSDAVMAAYRRARREDPVIGRAWAMLHTIGCDFIHDVV
jgi:hypothetical protein